MKLEHSIFLISFFRFDGFVLIYIFFSIIQIYISIQIFYLSKIIPRTNFKLYNIYIVLFFIYFFFNFILSTVNLIYGIFWYLYIVLNNFYPILLKASIFNIFWKFNLFLDLCVLTIIILFFFIQYFKQSLTILDYIYIKINKIRTHIFSLFNNDIMVLNYGLPFFNTQIFEHDLESFIKKNNAKLIKKILQQFFILVYQCILLCCFVLFMINSFSFYYSYGCFFFMSGYEIFKEYFSIHLFIVFFYIFYFYFYKPLDTTIKQLYFLFFIFSTKYNSNTKKIGNFINVVGILWDSKINFLNFIINFNKFSYSSQDNSLYYVYNFFKTSDSFKHFITNILCTHFDFWTKVPGTAFFIEEDKKMSPISLKFFYTNFLSASFRLAAKFDVPDNFGFLKGNYFFNLFLYSRYLIYIYNKLFEYSALVLVHNAFNYSTYIHLMTKLYFHKYRLFLYNLYTLYYKYVVPLLILFIFLLFFIKISPFSFYDYNFEILFSIDFAFFKTIGYYLEYYSVCSSYTLFYFILKILSYHILVAFLLRIETLMTMFLPVFYLYIIFFYEEVVELNYYPKYQQSVVGRIFIRLLKALRWVLKLIFY